MKNYYEILGVDESANQADIKKSFRSLAFKYHPDRNKEPDAEGKFKEINEAYDTLGDESKRQNYDNQRKFGNNPMGGFHFHNMSGGGFHNMEDILGEILRGGGFGGFRPNKNPDTNIQLSISMEDAYNGKSVPIQFTDNTGHQINVTVNIYPGMESGTRVRFPGNGSKQNQNLPPGDLYVVVVIAPHPTFERSGPHLLTKKTISLWESLVGCDASIQTIDGGKITVKIPPLTKDGSMLKVKNKGMPVNPTNMGDLMVQVSVSTPTHLTDEQINIINTWI